MNELSFVAKKQIYGELTPPPSKSYTHRAILIASIADGVSHIQNTLVSRDTIATIESCKAFGANINMNRNQLAAQIEGTRPRVPDDVINVENSGTTLRFLTSVMTGSSRGYAILTGDSSIRRRPMQPLLDSLAGLGGKAYSARFDGHAPIIAEGETLEGGETAIEGKVSSQFVSSILISSVLSRRGVRLFVKGAVSKPYIEATLLSMKRFGVEVQRDGFEFFEVSKGARYSAGDFSIPSDFSSIAFLVGSVAAAGGKLRLNCSGLDMPQADSRILTIAKKMGIVVKASGNVLTIESYEDRLEGGKFVLSDSPDLLPVLSVLGLKTKGGIEIRGVEHARFKETDRISAIREELTKAGAVVKEERDGISVRGGELVKTTLDSRGDHRLFMAFSLVSLLSHGEIKVTGEESVDVSYPGYINDLHKIGVEVRRG
ncbi:MAG: 3-phosphoshikimate 1-carboxyvinyltransferase [Conexivisphaerales archaeon]